MENERAEKTASPPRTRPGLVGRLGWFVLIWLGGVAALSAAALLMRMGMSAIGLAA